MHRLTPVLGSQPAENSAVILSSVFLDLRAGQKVKQSAINFPHGLPSQLHSITVPEPLPAYTACELRQLCTQAT